MASGPSALRLPRLGAFLGALDVKPQNLIFSLNSLIAVALALYIGFAADLPRPYWAVLTVYITANPLTGALRSKALFRVIGTVLGAIVAVILIPNLVNSPGLLSAALAAWIGLCIYISALDRMARAYVFVLSGYTVAFIGFPIVDQPQNVFDTAVARVEEIIVGVLCATFVHTISFPREVTVALNGRVAKFLHDGQTFASAVLLGDRHVQGEQERRKFITDVAELQNLAENLPFDTSNLRPRTRAVRALQDRLALLLPLVAGIEDRLDSLRGLGALPGDLEAVLRDVAAHLQNPDSTSEDAEALRAQSLASAPPLDFAQTGTIWPSLLAASAAVRLSEFVEAWRDSLLLARFVAEPLRAPPRVDELLRQVARRPFHREHGLAVLSGLGGSLAVLICCAIWIASAWTQGSTAALFAAAVASLFVTLDAPQSFLTRFLFWVIVATPVSAFYLFAALPAIDGFPMLILVLSPFYLVVGYMQADPVQFMRAFPLLLGVTGLLALQETYNADFETFANTSLAEMFGVALAISATITVRGAGALWSVRKILKQGWQHLAALASGRRLDNPTDWTNLMLDRLALVTRRLAIVGPSEDLKITDAFTDLAVGLNIIVLRETGWRPPELADMLTRLSVAYAARTRASAGFDPGLLAAIDRVLAALGRAEPQSLQVCASLVGLRRRLFPEAQGFAALP